MHPNSIYREPETARNLQFVTETGFGHLVVSSEDYPLVSHLPFLLMEDAQEVELHLVRSNPIARLLKRSPVKAKLAVTGPHGYISPDWY
jgi:transcriptional regulator